MKPLSVCIIGLKCYDHIAGKPIPRYLGGVETQLSILAKGLAAAGCRVSLITYDHGQPDGETFDGVTVFRSYRPEAGVRLARTLHPRLTGLVSAMRRADADVYLQMGAGIETAQAAIGCRAMFPTRRLVFCLASNCDFGSSLRLGKFGWEGKAYRFGLWHADLAISQTQHQRNGLLQATQIDSRVIQMAVAPPRDGGPSHRVRRDRILWIGRITAEKRLEWLIELAKKLPQYQFDVVGVPNKASEYARGVMQTAASLANIRVHGCLSVAALNDVYRRARLLCCTSELEGFPTSFLEAWSRGIPVVTTFDPDAIVMSNGLCAVADNPDDLAKSVLELMEHTSVHASIAVAAERYYSQHHTVEPVARHFRHVLEELFSRSDYNDRKRTRDRVTGCPKGSASSTL
jgi:glycosyltransferase involved in cell wall biosynthesis